MAERNDLAAADERRGPDAGERNVTGRECGADRSARCKRAACGRWGWGRTALGDDRVEPGLVQLLLHEGETRWREPRNRDRRRKLGRGARDGVEGLAGGPCHRPLQLSTDVDGL